MSHFFIDMTWFNHINLVILGRINNTIFNVKKSLISLGIWHERPFPLTSLHTEHWINKVQHIYYKELLNIAYIETISSNAMNPKCFTLEIEVLLKVNGGILFDDYNYCYRISWIGTNKNLVKKYPLRQSYMDEK